LVAAQQQFDNVQVNMMRTFDSLERDQQGYSTSNGLLAVVNGLKAIPGRKTIVFFSEGLAITANVAGQFRSVISSANRANVAVYAIDAGGLRIESGIKESGDELRLASRQRAEMEGAGDAGMLGGSLTRGLERAEDLLRLDPSSGLGQLADETGGFLVRDTNDATPGFRRIQEDMRFYYLLSYTPANTSFAGSRCRGPVSTSRRARATTPFGPTSWSPCAPTRRPRWPCSTSRPGPRRSR
jgi:VWFA-related protein